MFDIAFSELVVIGVVALIVIGPEKLPKVARTFGLLAGRLQRYVSEVKEDISREIQLEDLKKLQEQIQEGGKKIQSELMLSKEEMTQHLDEVRETLLDIKSPANEPAGQVSNDSISTSKPEHSAQIKTILKPDPKDTEKVE